MQAAVKKQQNIPYRDVDIEREKRRRARAIQRKNMYKHKYSLNRKMIAKFSLRIVVIASIFVFYLSNMSDLNTKKNEMSNLQSEYQTLKEENDSLLNNAMDDINIESIREEAVNNFGMKYASDDQIITYDNPISNNMSQYEDVQDGKR